MSRRGRRNPGGDLTIVDIPTSWVGSGGVRPIPWEVRSEVFTFPPTEPTRVATPEGVAELRRPLTEEEVLRKRTYLEIRVFPHEPAGPPGKIDFRVYYRLLFEIVGGVTTTPRLPEWRKERFSRGVTDLDFLHHGNLKPATNQEVEMFLEWLNENRPEGLRL